MSQLAQLYQETLMEHAKKPRNFGRLEGCTHRCHGKNPVCGDDYMLELILEGDKIRDVRFHGDGCAISKASASLMTVLTAGKECQQTLQLCRLFTDMLIREQGESLLSQLPVHLQIFAGVREFPMRVKCATLIWRTLESMLTGSSQLVSTEEG